VREPLRGVYDIRRPARARPSLFHVMAVLARRPSFWGLSWCRVGVHDGLRLFFWMPSFLVRSFALSLVQASLAYGALILIGGLAGISLGGMIADRRGANQRSIYALIPACAFLATIPFYVAGVLSSTIEACVLILLVPTALGLAWLGPVLTAVQHLVPPDMRATASALFLFINNLIGIGLERHSSASCRTCSACISGTTLCVTPSSRERDSMCWRPCATSLRPVISQETGKSSARGEDPDSATRARTRGYLRRLSVAADPQW